jgi:hypothetical protein
LRPAIGQKGGAPSAVGTCNPGIMPHLKNIVGYNDPQVIMTHNLLLIPGSPGKSSDIHMYVQVILECQHAEYFETFSVTLRQKSLKQNSLRV